MIQTEMPEFTPGPDDTAAEFAPDPKVRFGHWAAQALLEGTARYKFESRGPSPDKVRDYIRPSDAGKCARQLWYVATGVERSNPMDLAGAISTTLGSFLGGVLANALIDNAEKIAKDLGKPIVEVVAEFRFSEIDESDDDAERTFTVVETKDGPVNVDGFLDVVIVFDDGTEIVLEVKTVGDYGFKAKTGNGRSRIPEGPDMGHVRQLAEYVALRPNAVEGVVVYLATNPLSKPVAAKAGLDERQRVAAEWTYSREELEPIAASEMRRHRRVLQLAAEGTPAPRRIPGMPGGEIVNPATGAWRSEDGDKVMSFWGCGYCGWQDRCAKDIVEERDAEGAKR